MDTQIVNILSAVGISAILLGKYMNPEHTTKFLLIHSVKTQWILKAVISVVYILVLNTLFYGLKNDKNNFIFDKLKIFDLKKWTSKFPDVSKIIMTFLSDLFNGIKNRFVKWINGLVNQITSFFPKIGLWFKNLGQWFYDYFKPIVSSFVTLPVEISSWLATKSMEYFQYYILGTFIFIAHVTRELVTAFFMKVILLPATIAKDAINSAFPKWAKNAINDLSGGGFDAAVNAAYNTVVKTMNPVRDALKGAIPDVEFDDFY